HLWQLETLGIPVASDLEGTLWIHPDAEKNLRERLLDTGLQRDSSFILMSPGSKSDLKRWNASSYAAVSDRLYQDKKIPVVLVGEKNDQPFTDAISASAHRPLYSLVGQTSIPEWVVMVRDAALLITNDNAALHIASLLGTPTVAIFGPTDPRKYGPRAPKHRVVRRDLFCAPCEKPRCPYHHECMEQLPVEEVYQACVDLLSPL
ncbi:MAG: glycosyltransferase family 9 protein, partial [Candidatus Omnitrophota bacterium]